MNRKQLKKVRRRKALKKHMNIQKAIHKYNESPNRYGRQEK